MKLYDLLNEAEINDLGAMNDKMRDMLSKVKADDEAHAQAVADKKEKDRQARAAAMGEKGMQSYIQKLKGHDWSHEMSDDHSAWQAGHAEKNEIRRLQQILDPDFDIYNKYAPEGYKVKVSVKETTSAGSIAANAGAGFASGGIGTLSRAGTVQSNNNKKKKKKSSKR